MSFAKIPNFEVHCLEQRVEQLLAKNREIISELEYMLGNCEILQSPDYVSCVSLIIAKYKEPAPPRERFI